jgi:dTDP-4-amino-4,6-dideoxygalactose transaminase
MIWDFYHQCFEELEQQGKLRRPIVPEECTHNAHMYYLLLNTSSERDRFISFMHERGISTVFHYIPLHSSPMGTQCARASGELNTTNDISTRLVRIPLWVGVEKHQREIIRQVHGFFEK